MKNSKTKKTIIKQFVSTAAVLLALVLPAFGFGSGVVQPSDAAVAVDTDKASSLTIAVRPQQGGEILQVPLFSEQYAQLPVATVNDEPITVKDFSLRLAGMHDDMTKEGLGKRQNLTELLDRLIAVKLVKQEALNIGFDRTPEFESQVKKYALTNMIKMMLARQIVNIQVPEAEIDDLYQKMALEAKLLTYRFKKEEDAKALVAISKDGGDFKQLADQAVKAGKAEGGEEPEFARLTDMFPSVAKAVYDMEPGSVSEVFKGGNGYLIFRLEDRRVYDDPAVRLAAANRLREEASKKKQYDYLKTLIDKYVTYDEDAKAALDFTQIEKENPGIMGTEVFPPLVRDERVLAIISDGKETVNITVAEIAEKVKETMYHGLNRAIDGPALDEERDNALWNASVEVSGRLEAQAQGIDQLQAYKDKVDRFKEKTLFETFMAKAVVPGIRVPEQEAMDYYEEHLEDYSSPLMLQMKSLVFTNKEAAMDAYKKLQAGSDFKWVSANTTDQADPDHKDLLNLGNTLLAETALPEDLQKQVEGVRPGEVIFYEGPDDLYYALVIEKVFEPEAKPYQEVRQEVGKIVYARLIKEALEDWVAKLKEAYETKVFLVQE